MFNSGKDRHFAEPTARRTNWFMALLLHRHLSSRRSGKTKRPRSGNRHVEDTLHHGRGFLVDNPAVFVLRVAQVAVGRLAQMLAAGATRFHDGADFLAGIAAVEIIEHTSIRKGMKS